MLVTALYDSTLPQSIMSYNEARLKFDLPGDTFTTIDTTGMNESAILVAIDTITDDTQHAICVCSLTAATHATGKLTWDQVAYLDAKMATAYKGTSVRANTCQANATVTEIILDNGASSANDFYNFTRFGQEYYIKTAGVTAIYRYIKDYTGASVDVLVNTTTTPITNTETFIVYSQPNVYLLGDANSTQNACRIAWTTLFGSTNIPLVVQIMGGYGTGFKYCDLTELTCDSIAAGTLTDGTAFTANKYNSGEYVVALRDTGGGTYTQGYIRNIASNTVSVLTLASNWPTTPTGTPTYAIYNERYALYDLYLTYSIPSLLWDSGVNTHNIWKAMLDRYGDTVSLATAQTSQDLATLDVYAEKGKAVVEALAAGIVS